jgi:hypothetical protein
MRFHGIPCRRWATLALLDLAINVTRGGLREILRSGYRRSATVLEIKCERRIPWALIAEHRERQSLKKASIHDEVFTGRSPHLTNGKSETSMRFQ